MRYKNAGVVFFVAFSLVVFLPCAGFSATDLENAALKEGKVSWYSAWPKPLMDEIVKAFKVHYPKIDVMMFRSGSSKIAAKLLTEKEAGAILCDVFTVSDESIVLDFKEKGIFEKYTPEEYQHFDKKFRDPDGYWATPRVYTVTIWYNVEKFKKDKLPIPTSWRSLADPRYKGRLVYASPLYSGTMTSLVGYFVSTQEFGWNFWEKAKANEALFVNDVPDVARMVSTGERELGATIWGYISMFPEHPAGTIKAILPEEGVLVLQSTSSLVKGGPQPNAGKLFQKYLMSLEAAKLIVRERYYSGRTDAPAPEGMPSLFSLKTFRADPVWLEKNKREVLKQWSLITGQR